MVDYVLYLAVDETVDPRYSNRTLGTPIGRIVYRAAACRYGTSPLGTDRYRRVLDACRGASVPRVVQTKCFQRNGTRHLTLASFKATPEQVTRLY